MGIGKYLHRKKGDTPSPQQPSRQSRVVSQGNTDSALGISRYEATAPGSKPETGSYPIRGNNSTAAVNSRRGSIRNSMDTRSNQPTRPDTAPSHPVGSTAPRLETPPNNNYADYHFFDQPPTNTQTRTQTTTTTTTFAGRQQQRQMEADSGLARDFSGLNLGSNSARGSTRSSPIANYPNSGTGRLDPRVDSPPRNDPSIRLVDQSAPQQQYKLPSNYQRGGVGYYDNPSRGPAVAGGSPSGPTGRGGLETNKATAVPPRVSSSDYTDSHTFDMRRRDSIPRKQVGSSTHTPSASVTSTSPHVPGSFAEDVDLEAPPVPQHDRPLSQQPEYQQYNTSPEQVYGHKPLPEHGRYQERALETRNHHGASQQPPSQITPSRGARHQQPWEDANESTYSPSTEHRVQPREFPGRGPKDQRGDDYIAPLAVRSKRASTDYAAQPSGNDVVERTNSNTYDTEVIEKVAPAVVHEKVQEKVHHVREEVITREIHTHDVLHRILPVIDVEVLPPRHFLPVEGGGLVEIGADEVPGRGNNWVIAETASKIPSDQPAPKGPRQFTARQFPGTEGDAIQYTTPDGVEHTETTWVHPPELETGGQDTGQTWPMIFGKGSSSDGRLRTEESLPSKHAKSRSKKRSSASRTTGTTSATEPGYLLTA